jgi:hypothetical protein
MLNAMHLSPILLLATACTDWMPPEINMTPIRVWSKGEQESVHT